ncbi:MAG: hypothetical protein BroJett026_14710 [Betaproteobacteria bacterium]|nr:MAG: hypothetical protein BroJett026_14710 [Betaproteobacteria bacterium]
MTGLSDDDAAAVERGIAAVEAATGVQVVAALVPRADDYPEAPWRAFALGAALAALAALGWSLAFPAWLAPAALLAQALAILATGGAAAIAARYVPAVGRAFVGAARAEAEARQCADALFLARELFATPRREAILILVAAFERRVVVVPDAGFRGRVTAAEWRGVVDRMTPSLRRDAVREAFAQGLAALEALLRAKGCGPGDGANRLPDGLVRGSGR